MGRSLSFGGNWNGSKLAMSESYFWLTFVNRRHIISDLRPYVCTVLHCPFGTDTFNSMSAYLRHETQWHKTSPGTSQSSSSESTYMKENESCTFCGLTTTGAMGKNSWCRHVGRHMEEIAFTVISKTYKDWEFYSDSATTGSSHDFNGQPSESRFNSAAPSRAICPGDTRLVECQ